MRISDDREGAGLGVKRQAEDCQALAARYGWQVAEVYVDDNRSAFSGRERPEYRRMLDDLAAGRRDGVLAWHTDRLHRSPLELEEFIDIVDRGRLPVHTVKAGPLDLATPAGRMVARQLGAVARYESEHRAARNRRKAEELAAEGKVSGGGTRPYGYTQDRRMVVESEAEVVRELARRALDGEGVRTLCRDLDQRGITTVTGRQWQPQTLTRMLGSARISGRREHHGRITADAEWPAIITADDSDRLRQVLRDSRRRVSPGGGRRYLLSGIARCARCGNGLAGRPNELGKVRYVCDRRPNSTRCGGTFILAAELDEYVVGLILAAVDGPALASATADASSHDDLAAVAARIERAETKLKTLAHDHAVDRITRDEWLAARDALQPRIEEDRRRISSSRGLRAVEDYLGRTGALAAAWEALNLNRRRAVITAVLDGVDIGPGRRGYNRFDPTRVRLTWRV